MLSTSYLLKDVEASLMYSLSFCSFTAVKGAVDYRIYNWKSTFYEVLFLTMSKKQGHGFPFSKVNNSKDGKLALQT